MCTHMKDGLLCQFKDVFGKPGQGFHSARLAGLALYDVIGTVVLAWVLYKWYKVDPLCSFVVLFSLGVFLHWLFCVETPVIAKLRNWGVIR